MNLETRRKIREAYKNWEPRTSPYNYADWSNLFSPIERNVWHDIRSNGLPFYPQFPVGPYFIDFADPRRKIAIEVDGKEFHSSAEDKKKDKERERFLRKEGWMVFRIQGRQTYKDRDWYMNFCREHRCVEEGKEICARHFEEYETDSSEGILLDIHHTHSYFEFQPCSSPEKN